MTQKVQVSREVATVLDKVESLRLDFDWVMGWAIDRQLPGEYSALNDMPLSKLATALLVGYEVEETPEEKWAEIYRKLSAKLLDECFVRNAEHANRIAAKQSTIKAMAKDFGLKIEGVNA